MQCEHFSNTSGQVLVCVIQEQNGEKNMVFLLPNVLFPVIYSLFILFRFELIFFFFFFHFRFDLFFVLILLSPTLEHFWWGPP